MANPEHPKLAESFASTLKKIQPDIALSVVRLIFQPDCLAELPKFNKLTLLLQAKEDITVPIDVAEYLHKNIADSKLTILKAYSHFPHLSAPREII